MKKIETNNIPYLLEKKVITAEEAENFLWSEIYFNPQKYNLFDLDEDDLSDFLLKFHKRFNHIIEKYDSTKTDFTTFIRCCMMQFKNTWKKLEAKNYAELKSLEEAIQKGNVESIKFVDLDSNPEKIYLKENLETESKKLLQLTKKNISEAKETALILALKACKDMDDDSISKLSKFTEKTEFEIQNMLENMKQNLGSKEKNRNQMLKRRDKSYFQKRKLRIELEKLEEDSSEHRKLKNTYENQIKNWKKTNENLTHRYLMSPKNSEIAKMLGISTRKVFYCISHAKNESIMENFQKVFKHFSENGEKTEKN